MQCTRPLKLVTPTAVKSGRERTPAEAGFVYVPETASLISCRPVRSIPAEALHHTYVLPDSYPAR